MIVVIVEWVSAFRCVSPRLLTVLLVVEVTISSVGGVSYEENSPFVVTRTFSDKVETVAGIS